MDNSFTIHKNTCQENFMNNLNEQRNNKEFCDVTIKAKNNDTFLVHKNVICAASSFFQALFKSNFSDKTDIELSIISSDVLKILIEFMYGQEISIQVKEIRNILDGALFLGLYNLVDSCTQVLIKTINKTNKFELLKYAETYINIHGNKLAKECLKLVVNDDIQTIIKTEDFLQLSFDAIRILISMERNGSYLEENLYLSIIEWISFDIENRKQYVRSLINGIHFDQISDDFFLSKIYENHDNPLYKNVDFLQKTMEKTKSVLLQKDKMKNFDLSSVNGNIYAVFGQQMVMFNRFEKGFSKFIANITDEDFGYTNFKNQGIFLCGGKKTETGNNSQAVRSRFGKNTVPSSNFHSDNVVSSNSNGNCCKYFSFHMNLFCPLPSMPYAKTNHRAVTLNDQIYVCGGLNTSSVEIFDLNMIFWRHGQKLKACTSDFGLCTLNGSIYATGSKYLERFDPREPRWTILSEKDDESNYSVAVGYNNFIYKFDNSGCKKFDIRQNEWINDAIKNVGDRIEHACSVDNEIYAIDLDYNLFRLNCENDSIVEKYELQYPLCHAPQYALFCL